MGKRIELSGKKYGRLKITTYAGIEKGKAMWNYECDCGRIGKTESCSIRMGHTKSCGHCNENQYCYLEHYGIVTVTLASGETFAVDDESADKIKRCQWCIGGNGYVVSHMDNKRIFLHKYILDAPRGVMVDHINRDKMDNRKSNLRITTKSLNAANSKVRKDNIKTGHRNIKIDNRSKLYVVRITKDGTEHYFGAYKELERAVEAANKGRRELFGEYAYYDNHNNYVCPLTSDYLKNINLSGEKQNTESKGVGI